MNVFEYVRGLRMLQKSGRRRRRLIPSSAKPDSMMAAAVFHTLRLEPGADVLQSLQQFAEQIGISAGFVASAVGSVTRCNIRFANQPTGTLIGPAHFEIVSLCGTVAQSGCHVHVSLSDGAGVVVGGHLLAGRGTGSGMPLNWTSPLSNRLRW